jgi:ribonuclease J
MSRFALSGRGFSDGPKVSDVVLPLAEGELSRTEAEGITDTHRIAQAVRRVVGKWVGETYRRRPMIVPTVIPV